MNWEIIISAFVIVVGWFIGHALSSLRDRSNKRRELRVGYLIEAWRNLADCTGRSDLARASILEKAIADINLFGSEIQIDLAKKFSDDFVNKRTANLDELLKDLRYELRKELQLDPVSISIYHLRVGANDEKSKK